jgi:hypothetical protein
MPATPVNEKATTREPVFKTSRRDGVNVSVMLASLKRAGWRE